MTPLTNQNLVEALEDLQDFIQSINFDVKHHAKAYMLVNKAGIALKEASAPMKEFAGMDKAHWENLSRFLNNTRHQELFSEEAAACRMIAEGLSE